MFEALHASRRPLYYNLLSSLQVPYLNYTIQAVLSACMQDTELTYMFEALHASRRPLYYNLLLSNLQAPSLDYTFQAVLSACM